MQFLEYSQLVDTASTCIYFGIGIGVFGIIVFGVYVIWTVRGIRINWDCFKK